MSKDSFVTVKFQPIYEFRGKCRKTRLIMRRISCAYFLGDQKQKGTRYFVECLSHEEISGPYRNVTLANTAMAHPETWCRWCAPFFGKEIGAAHLTGR